ncbi:uncharacterized protein PRCAT00004969001 [Priceomyces carsonii]|uniref:uncharacterized protein n=1 Tax=Priceomyces carsonii TaxID=28549 RepID=UPI002EDA25D6|nr:unnamed protein product [Priceomyces carsonii]
MNKVVLITGCSSGIGHATAIEFALKGYKVIAGARRLERMKDLEHYGVKIISLDVTSQLDVEELKKLIENEYYGRLDILYNNAGQGCAEPGIEASDELVRQCMKLMSLGL